MIVSARYANPSQSAALVSTSDRGEILISQADTPAQWAEMLAAVTPSSYAAPAVPVPEFVTPLQARKALRAAGLKAPVDSFVASLPEEQREEWEYCVEVRRDSALIAAAATALGLSISAVDDLFHLAATL